MKRTLLLAGCLLLCAGCAKKVAPQPIQDPTQPTDGAEVNICVDQEGHWLSCPDEQQAKPLPPMVAPTMRDVVTHRQELSCDKGYERWVLSAENAKQLSPSEWELPPEYHVCVTPAFIAELKKANGEK